MRTPALRKQIDALIAHWRPIMGLDTWMIDVRYDETKHKGTCVASPRYEEAIINFNLSRVRAECRTPESVEDLIVHELAHCMAWRANETTVTRIARALLRAAGRTLL